MPQKRENLRFSTCLTLLRSYSIYLVKRQERSLIKSSFSVFWQKGNFILPFAVNREFKHDVYDKRQDEISFFSKANLQDTLTQKHFKKTLPHFKTSYGEKLARKTLLTTHSQK